MQTATCGASGMKPTVLPEAVMSVLKQARIEQNRLYLPPNMDKKLYRETDKVLKELDGKWTTKSGCHIFKGNAENYLRPVIETGQIYFAKSQDFFWTPVEIIDTIFCWAEIEFGHHVLEPSAGAGNIAVEIRDYFRQFVKLDLVEINPRLVGKLYDQGFTPENGYRVECRDFLTFQPGYLYDRCVMNPPFQAEIAHVRHAYSLLKPGGILVSVMSNAMYTRNDRQTDEFWRDFRKDVNIEIDNDDILPQAFKAAGTKVKTWTICFIKD